MLKNILLDTFYFIHICRTCPVTISCDFNPVFLHHAIWSIIFMSYRPRMITSPSKLIDCVIGLFCISVIGFFIHCNCQQLQHQIERRCTDVELTALQL